MKVCIDRFEGDRCILQSSEGVIHEVPREQLPEGAREGQWFTWADGILLFDRQETDAVTKRIQAKMDRLWQ